MIEHHTTNNDYEGQLQIWIVNPDKYSELELFMIIALHQQIEKQQVALKN